MEAAETTSATSVETPARMRTGLGSLEPLPSYIEYTAFPFSWMGDGSTEQRWKQTASEQVGGYALRGALTVASSRAMPKADSKSSSAITERAYIPSFFSTTTV